MRILIAVLIALTAASCSTISPVYQFYAHKHAVPMLGGQYVRIPDSSPQQHQVFVDSYQGAGEHALSMLESHRDGIMSPGISAAVAVDGELVWAGVSGWSDIETRTPMSLSSQFRIGSTSKALTSTLLARLVDKKSLSLDTPLSEYRIGNINNKWQSMTPRHLASHTAGLPHYKQNTDWHGLYKSIALNTHYDNVNQAVRLFDTSDTLFAPGDGFSYSSYGTVLLSAVMQEAADVPFQQAMVQEVIVPLGMTGTLPEPIAENRQEDAPNLVSFYWRSDAPEKTLKVWRDVDLSHRLAGGGFVSTSTDLVKLGLGFINPDYISSATRAAFWTPQTLNNGEVNEQGYAIGWRVRESDFGDVGTLFHANHGGVSRGAQSWLMVLPEVGMVVAVNINAKTDHFWDFGKVSFDLVKHFLSARSLQSESAFNRPD